MALSLGRSTNFAASAIRRAVFCFDGNFIVILKERLSLCDVAMYVVSDHW
jgi:hypothetical protein